MLIYKKDTKGKLRFLEVINEGADLVQKSGIVGTDNVVEHRKTCVGKNIGKSNETTPEEQAVLERDAKIKDKLTEGYFKTIKEVETTEVILPMLAKDYKKEAHKIDWKSTVYAQPKLDGMRCLAAKENGKIVLKSRDGKVISTVKHIETALMSITEDLILDGELYYHGFSFQENMKLIKKYREGETENISYHIYDIVSEDPFYERVLTGDTLFAPPLKLVKSYLIKNEEELKVLHSMFLNEGYEGTMIRHGKEGYKANGRSSNLLKYKDFLDITCKIVDIIPAESRPEWGVPVLEYNGKQFRAGTKISHEERKELLINKKNYIGKTAELRFFEYTDDEIPRFPVYIGLRLDK